MTVLEHLPVLDGIRGWAAWTVLVFHILLFGGNVSFIGPQTAIYLFRLIYAFWIAVDCFFVLSGFLITSILYKAKLGDAKRTDYNWRKNFFVVFYWRRFLRIYPAYYAAILGVLIAGWAMPLLQTDSYNRTYAATKWLLLYVSNFYGALYADISQGLPYFWEWGSFMHFWSLSVEEHFYLVWPFVIYFVPLRFVRYAPFPVWIGSIIFRLVGYFHYGWDASKLYALTPGRLDGFAIGSYLAIRRAQNGTLADLLPYAKVAFAVGFFTVLGESIWHFYFWLGNRFVGLCGFTLVDIGFGGLIVLAIELPQDSYFIRIFDNDAMKILGKYSYGFYLISNYFITVFLDGNGFADGGIFVKVCQTYFPFLWKNQFVKQLFHVLASSKGARMAAFVFVTWVLTYISFQYYELPILKFKDLLTYTPPPKPKVAEVKTEDLEVELDELTKDLSIKEVVDKTQNNDEKGKDDAIELEIDLDEEVQVKT